MPKFTVTTHIADTYQIIVEAEDAVSAEKEALSTNPKTNLSWALIDTHEPYVVSIEQEEEG